jgi:hypothetical protein
LKLLAKQVTGFDVWINEKRVPSPPNRNKKSFKDSFQTKIDQLVGKALSMTAPEFFAEPAHKLYVCED